MQKVIIALGTIVSAVVSVLGNDSIMKMISGGANGIGIIIYKVITAIVVGLLVGIIVIFMTSDDDEKDEKRFGEKQDA